MWETAELRVDACRHRVRTRRSTWRNTLVEVLDLHPRACARRAAGVTYGRRLRTVRGLVRLRTARDGQGHARMLCAKRMGLISGRCRAGIRRRDEQGRGGSTERSQENFYAERRNAHDPRP